MKRRKRVEGHLRVAPRSYDAEQEKKIKMKRTKREEGHLRVAPRSYDAPGDPGKVDFRVLPRSFDFCVLFS